MIRKWHPLPVERVENGGMDNHLELIHEAIKAETPELTQSWVDEAVEAFHESAQAGLALDDVMRVVLARVYPKMAAKAVKDDPHVLRMCLIPGCFKQYDAVATMSGEPPARPECSGEGWFTIRATIPFPGGSHICPDHFEALKAHIPQITYDENRMIGIDCLCGEWKSEHYYWHRVPAVLWEQHMLVDVLRRFDDKGDLKNGE